MSLLFALSVALICCTWQPEVQAQLSLPNGFNGTNIISTLLRLPYEVSSEVFVDILPPLLGYQPGNINGSYKEFMKEEFKDTSEDDIAFSSTQEILVRSGYKFENYYVTSKDGYVTIVIRIINPLADQKQLKPVPVVIFHGGFVDMRIYLVSSASKHHPEKYPRTQSDGPITSSNRSIPLTLANNGYDVYLIGTRGSNKQNVGRNLKGQLIGPFPTTAYWRYTMDDISQKEMENQVDKVLNITGKSEVDMVTFSLSTMIALQAFAENPSFPRKKVHTKIFIAPIINNEGTSYFVRLLIREVCLKIELDIGTAILSQFITTKPTRVLLDTLSRDKQVRYTLVKFLEIIFAGANAQYLNYLQRPVISNVLHGTSFGEFKQYCQQVTANQLQKFDYGSLINKKLYGQPKPPVYDISQNFNFTNLYIISGGLDNLAPIGSVNKIMDSLYRRPDVHNFIPQYNHLGPVGAFDNAKLVTLPLLEFLDSHQN